MMRLWPPNLYISCGKCNRQLGDKIKWCPQSIKLLGIYGMIKGIALFFKVITAAFFLTLLYKDVSAGGVETSFSGQIIIGAYEAVTALELSGG